jgi:hypothetical protein
VSGPLAEIVDLTGHGSISQRKMAGMTNRDSGTAADSQTAPEGRWAGQWAHAALTNADTFERIR